MVPLGVDSIDAVLAGGGSALGAVHEICEQGTDGSRASLASLFAASILARLAKRFIRDADSICRILSLSVSVSGPLRASSNCAVSRAFPAASRSGKNDIWIGDDAIS